MADGSTPRRCLSVVVPVHGNRDSVAETLSQVLAVQARSFAHLDLEVVFVDDGSPDDSWDILQGLRAAHPHEVRLVKLSRNFGQVSAILAGFDVVKGDAVVTISADLQDPVELIEQMVSHWQAGAEIVVAQRARRDDDLASVLFSRVAYGVARFANPRIPRGGFDYLLLSRRAKDHIREFRGRHRFFQGDVLWLGLPTVFIPYERRARTHGRSGWTLSKKLTYFIDLILDSSYLPIRLMSALGLVIATLGLLYALVVIAAWLFNSTPFEGFAAIMVVLLVIGGTLMVMLGTVGEYLWRIYDDVKARPLYIIERLEVGATSEGQDGDAPSRDPS